MKLTLALALLLMFCQPAFAGQEDDLLIAKARASVAETLQKSESQVSFGQLRVVHDELGSFVCGEANGQRFLDGPSGRNNKPTLERAYSASVFNLLWNSRCRSMSTAEATASFKRDLDEEVCSVKNWNWVRWGTRSIQIQGLTSCQSGRILVKAFEGDEFLGVGKGNIEAGTFTVYIDRIPKKSSLRIEYATGK